MEINAKDYERFAAKLKASDRVIARGVRKRLRDISNPLAAKVMEEGSAALPQSGGLAEHVRASAYRRNSMTSSGIRIRLGSRAAGLGKIDLGSIRHPVYGNRKNWVSQGIDEGVFSEEFQALASDVRNEMRKVMQDFVRGML